jgi:hypothetical protein
VKRYEFAGTWLVLRKKGWYNVSGMESYCRVRWTVLRHKTTGEVVIVDAFRKRLEKMRKRIVAWAEIVEPYAKKNRCRTIMVRLSYAKIEDYQAGHIREYLKRCKERLGNKLLAWAWVAELQERGAVHYHVLVVVPKGTKFPMPDVSGMWKQGSSNVQTARAGAWYLVKYVGKEYQKDLSKYPKGCRLYGTSIRFGGDEKRIAYRALSGLLNESKNGNKGEWFYEGSAVTEGYARGVLEKKARSYTR